MWFKSECDKISDRLWDYTAQRLSVAETAQIENHLQQCAKCQAEAEGYRQTLGLLSAARSMPVPASQTTWRDLRPSLQPERRSVNRSAEWLPRLTLAGAGTVMAATLLVVFFSSNRRPGTVIPAATPSNTVAQVAPNSVDPHTAQSDNNIDNSAGSESEPTVKSGPTMASVYAAMTSFPSVQGSNKLTHATLSPSTVTRLTRPRRHNESGTSRLAINVGRSRSNRAVAATDASAHLEGDNATTGAQKTYVLKPVSQTSDDETPQAHRYVISSIPSAQAAVASNDGGDEGRAW